MNKEKLKGFIAGICTTAMLAGVATAIAYDKKLEEIWSGGIKVYNDLTEIQLLTEDKNIIEPINYKGSIYIPVRGVVELIGKEISFDYDTKSVYIGEQPENNEPYQTVLIDELRKSQLDCDTGIDISKPTYQIKNDYISCENKMSMNDGKVNIYAINGKYRKLEGSTVYPYSQLGADSSGIFKFYSLAEDGSVVAELGEYETAQTGGVNDFEIDLTGVYNLKIEFELTGGENYVANIINLKLYK